MVLLTTLEGGLSEHDSMENELRAVPVFRLQKGNHMLLPVQPPCPLRPKDLCDTILYSLIHILH
jgi:hypothetical protein